MASRAQRHACTSERSRPQWHRAVSPVPTTLFPDLAVSTAQFTLLGTLATHRGSYGTSVTSNSKCAGTVSVFPAASTEKIRGSGTNPKSVGARSGRGSKALTMLAECSGQLDGLHVPCVTPRTTPLCHPKTGPRYTNTWGSCDSHAALLETTAETPPLTQKRNVLEERKCLC